MANLSFTMDAARAWAFKPDEHGIMGYIVSFAIGSTSLTADINNMVDPTTSPFTTLAVVGIMKSFDWTGAPEDAMTISFLVSSANRQSLLTLVHQDVSQNSATFCFNIYDYDYVKFTFFRALHTNSSTISGLVATDQQSQAVRLRITVEATAELRERVWPVSITINPGSTAQSIGVATGSTQKFVKPWGVPQK